MPGNLLTQYGRFSYTTDRAAGRTLRRDTKIGEETHYFWDCRNQLREVRLLNSWKTRLFYDAFGRRVRKDFVPPDKTPEAHRTAGERHL